MPGRAGRRSGFDRWIGSLRSSIRRLGGNSSGQVVESTITFPYKRSLGPVIGAFMTALTEQRILGIRYGDQVLVPPLEWDPQTGAELGARLRRGRPRRHGRVVDVGARAVRAAPARPPVRVRPHPARRRRRRRCCTRSTPARPTRCPPACGSRPAGAAPAIGHINDIVAFVPGEDARGRRRRHRPGRRAGDDDGLQRVDHLPLPVTADRSCAPSRRTGAPPPRPAVPGLRARLRRRPRLLPDRRGRARRGARRRPPAAGHDHQLHDHHAGAVPGPDRDRAVRPGVRPARRHRRRARLPARASSSRSTTCASACGSRRCGPSDDELDGPRLDGARAASSAGCPPASPTSTTPTS